VNLKKRRINPAFLFLGHSVSPAKEKIIASCQLCFIFDALLSIKP